MKYQLRTREELILGLNLCLKLPFGKVIRTYFEKIFYQKKT